jgi:hypothetical protein
VLRSCLQVENEFDSVTWAMGLARFLGHGMGTELSLVEGYRWCAAGVPGWDWVTGLGVGLAHGLAVLGRGGLRGREEGAGRRMEEKLGRQGIEPKGAWV